ncbi:MAG TPA: flagellar biosynthesis protein FlhB [Gemmata sp.]
MAEEADQESKTEDPTPRRREEARRQGQVPFSAELVGSLVLVSGVLGLRYLGPDLWDTLMSVFRSDLPRAARGEFGPAEAAELIGRTALRALAALLPFFGALLLVGVASTVAQVGFQLNTEKLEPDITKLNPATGFGKLFSVAALVRGLLTILKVLALAAVAYFVLDGRGGLIAALGTGRLAGAVPVAWVLIMRLALYLTSAVALVAIIDYVYQRYRFEQSLMMTKEELKQELKQEEGDPLIKARIRQIARDRTKRKMLVEVPKATVVVTNPTHYAVALRYDPARDSAPVVVAKGKGVFAQQIARRARDSGVPVLERPPLARALQSVREGQPIPGVLFRAVAEVLAFVMRLRGGAL